MDPPLKFASHQIGFLQQDSNSVNLVPAAFLVNIMPEYVRFQ